MARNMSKKNSKFKDEFDKKYADSDLVDLERLIQKEKTKYLNKNPA